MIVNKKGISAVVATVLIILITVAAVAIIWAAVVPMIQKNLNKGTACFDAVSQVTVVDEGYTCKDSSGSVKFQVKRAEKDFVLTDIQAILTTSTGDVITRRVKKDFGEFVPDPNGGKVYTLEGEEYADSIKIEIAPIIMVGNTEETCGKSGGEVSLKPCSSEEIPDVDLVTIVNDAGTITASCVAEDTNGDLVMPEDYYFSWMVVSGTEKYCTRADLCGVGMDSLSYDSFTPGISYIIKCCVSKQPSETAAYDSVDKTKCSESGVEGTLRVTNPLS